MKTISSRSREVAELIRDRVPFKTHGALSAQTTTRGAGHLRGADLNRWYTDAKTITYVVYSYDTPIAWFDSESGWYRVGQRFSPTTLRHQGKLYLIPPNNATEAQRDLPYFIEGGTMPDMDRAVAVVTGILGATEIEQEDQS